MTWRHKHPSADKLASLAVGGLSPRRAARIQDHVTQCEECTRTCQQINAIRDVLASATYPPMPDDLSARIGSAISREARQRVAVMPATEAGRRDLPARRERAWTDGGWRVPGLSAAGTRLVTVASAVVIAAAGSYAVTEYIATNVTSSQSSPLAGAVAPAQQMSLGPDVTYGQPGSVDTIRAVDSRANFVAAHLRTEAISAVHTAESLDAFAAKSSASRAAPLTARASHSAAAGSTSRRLAGCIGLIAPGRTVLLIDFARYLDKPAAVIVTAGAVPNEAEAWVVGSSCSATRRDVLAEASLGSL